MKYTVFKNEPSSSDYEYPAEMGRNMDKFLLLMWKNWKLQIRHPVQTFFEICVPIFFCAIIVVVRSIVKSDHMPQRVYDPYNPFNTTVLDKYVKEILYSPNGSKIMEIMEGVKTSLPDTKFQSFDDSFALESFLVHSNDGTRVGVVFDNTLKNIVELPHKMKFSIRYPAEMHKQYKFYISNWMTNLLFPVLQSPGPRDPSQQYTADPAYYTEGYLTIQYAVSKAITEYFYKEEKVHFDGNTTLYMQRFPYSPYKNDPLLNVLQQMIGMIIVLAFIYTAMSTIKMITIEKEKQLKESMKIMGLPNWLHWTAWFVKTLSFMVVAITAIVILFKVEFWYKKGTNAVFPKCDVTLLFVFFILYACATITLCFAISVFFNKATVASNIGGVVFFFFYLPYSFLNIKYQSLSLDTKLLASLTSNSALGYGFMLICMFESTEEGLGWHNMWKTASPDDNLVMGHIFLMLILDTILYLVIALYVEALFPGKFGVPKKWNFFFQYFVNSKTRISGTGPIYMSVRRTSQDGINLDGEIQQDPSTYEIEPEGSTVGVKICHLRKVFDSQKVGVKDFSLNMLENQITVLLGHNGAGKTTTMSMLTGMFPPTSGTAIINGFDIRTEIDGVRSSLGLCPQHNILFDELTVAEHIYFFSRLKGMHAKDIEKEINTYVKLLKISDKKDMQSSTLSGGMKRKLSVAVAFCGNSKVVMLDEPTAGMDPAARRALWELVQSQKSGRTILMTTHFMDEADLLGDRIAIMQNGKLQCCGSSFFLKKKYGTGYHLIMEKGPNCSVEQITELLRNHLPFVKVGSNVGTELTYLLKEEDSGIFQEMFVDIENNSEELGIRSYGISLTTLEDVFMRVGADVGPESDTNSSTSQEVVDVECNGNIERGLDDFYLLTGFKLLKNQVIAMFMKRMLTSLRSWRLLLAQLILPIALLSIAIASSKESKMKHLPALPIVLEVYDKPLTVVSSNNPTNTFYVEAKNWLLEHESKILEIGNLTMESTILKTTVENPALVRQHYILGATYDDINNTIVGWFNNIPYHSPPLALNFIQNSIIRKLGSDYEIYVTNYPMPFTLKTLFKQLQSSNMAYQIALNIGTCMAFITAYYSLFYIRERVCKVKHLQFVSGINIFIFWIVSYIWDWITYFLTLICIMVTLICFHEEGFYTQSDLGRLFVVFFYFGFAIIPVLYVCSFIFSIPSMGFTRIFLFATILGNFGFIIVELLSVEAFDLTHVADILEVILLFVPYYCMSSGIKYTNFEFLRYKNCKNMVDNCVLLTHNSAEFCWNIMCSMIDNCCERQEHYYTWKKPGILRNILASLLVGVTAIALLFLIEFKIIQRVVYSLRKRHVDHFDLVDDDDDVKEENRKTRNMLESEIKNRTLVLKNVSKYYKKFLAVNGICLRVNTSECFGLLGVNGAGKTTTFRMMTGDLYISDGDIFINGLNLKTQIKDAYKLIGYCPQFDALFDDLSGRETIKLFCLLRGYTKADSMCIAKKLAKDFDFTKHIDTLVKNLSGGNKRKLSTALALVGNPPVVYLDEPTTGMDPATKRYLWNALCKVRDSGKSLVLTSHSMEECEALCTRLAIMVNGRFKCLGSTQHLKSRFSSGYTLTIKVRKTIKPDTRIAMVNIEVFIKENFPEATVTEKHNDLLTFYIPGSSIRWSTIFGVMEQGKGSLKIEDYYIGQASLEQVFLTFTKQQMALDGGF